MYKKQLKVLTEFITNCTNKSLKLKRSCIKQTKNVIYLIYNTCANLKKQFKQLASLLQKNKKKHKHCNLLSKKLEEVKIYNQDPKTEVGRI